MYLILFEMFIHVLAIYGLVRLFSIYSCKCGYHTRNIKHLLEHIEMRHVHDRPK